MTDVMKIEASQSFSINSAGVANSTLIPPGINNARVACTSNAHVRVGINAVATTQDAIVKAEKPETFLCSPNERVSVLAVSTAGTASVSWMVQ